MIRLRRGGYDISSGLNEVTRKHLEITTGITFLGIETINAVFQRAALKQTQGVSIQKDVISDRVQSSHLMVRIW